MIERYRMIDKLGEGTYGVVYRAQDRHTGRTYALKSIRLTQFDEGIPSTAIREISLLKELHSPNVVHLHDVVHSEKVLTMVFECLDTDLKKFMERSGPLTADVVKVCLAYLQLLKAIQVCHKNKILHRDLKPQNLMLNKDGYLKLGDFGLAREYGLPIPILTPDVVTLWYRAPDILLGSKDYGTSVDMWSVGCIFAEMFLGKPLFAGTGPADQLDIILRSLGTPTEYEYPEFYDLPLYEDGLKVYPKCESVQHLVEGMEPSGVDLLSRFLQVNPEHRIEANDALLHPYFADIPDDVVRMCEAKA